MSYSSIALTAPSTAEENEQVSVSTLVTNVSASDLMFRIKLAAVRDIYAVPGPSEIIGTIDVVIKSGQSQPVSGTFIMPAWDTSFIVMVYRFINYWDFDNYATTVISLSVPGLPTGTITKVEIEVDSTQAVPPVPGVEVDDDFLMHVWAQNTSSESVKMGLRYVITSPTGATIERRVDELWPYTGADQIHHFVEGPAGPEAMFDIDEPGTWLLQLYLYGDDILIDMMDVVMFTAVGEPPDEPTIIAGKIESVEIMVATGFLEGDRDVLSLPANVQTDTNYWLRVIGLNKTSESLRLGLRYVITKPNGNTISDETMEMWPYTGGDKLHEFIEPQTALTVDQSGEWKLKVELLGGSEKQVLDTWEGLMLTTGELPSGFILIRDHTYALASTYYGQAEQSTVTFTVVAPSFMLTDDKIAEIVTSLEGRFAEIDAHMLTLKLYEKRGLVQSDYSAVITTTIPTTATTEQTAPTIFGISTAVFIAIIIAVCLIVGLIIILVVRKDVSQFLFGTPPTNGEPGVPGLVDLIGNMVVIMMMIMMMEMMGPMLGPEEAPPRPKPVTEAVIRAGEGVIKYTGKAVKTAAPYVGRGIKKVTEYF